MPNADTVHERPRTLEEAKAWMLDRTRKRIHPMNNLSYEDTEGVVAQLQGLDPVNWAAAWTAAGEAAFAAGVAAREAGKLEDAKAQFLRADGFFFLGRFPCPNHPDKLASAARERDAYLAAGALFDPPIERVSVPFQGEEGDGDEVVFLLRRPKGIERPPVIVMWGGVDAWKEQMTAASDLALKQGVATVAIDGPGTGESPVKGRPAPNSSFCRSSTGWPRATICRAGCPDASAVRSAATGQRGWPTSIPIGSPAASTGAVAPTSCSSATGSKARVIPTAT